MRFLYGLSVPVPAPVASHLGCDKCGGVTKLNLRQRRQVRIACDFTGAIERSAVGGEDPAGGVFDNNPRAVALLNDLADSTGGHSDGLATVAEVENVVGHALKVYDAIGSRSTISTSHSSHRCRKRKVCPCPASIWSRDLYLMAVE